MLELLSRPWPWYVGGPLIGLLVPILLIAGNRLFGFSANFRHACAACLPAGPAFFRYDWRGHGGWNVAFAVGVLLGGAITRLWFADPDPIAIAESTRAALMELGVRDFTGVVPADLFSWSMLGTPAGLMIMVVGGFLVGFGTAYAGGCTSGHGITGLASFQLPSLIAVVGFFVGGLVSTHLLLPILR